MFTFGECVFGYAQVQVQKENQDKAKFQITNKAVRWKNFDSKLKKKNEKAKKQLHKTQPADN